MTAKTTIQVGENQIIRQYEETGFATLEKNGKYYIILGKQMACSTEYDTLEEAEHRILQTDWQLVITLLQAINNIKNNKDE